MVSLGVGSCAAPAAEPASSPTQQRSAAPTLGAAPATASDVREARTEAAPVPPDRQRPLKESTLLAELEKVGLKMGAFPPLEELSARQRLPVMEAFSAALGVKCTGCHVSDKDYAAETARKQLAREMWNHFTRPLRLDGKQVFCDSCHQGSEKILHRVDDAGVRQYMKQEFTGKLTTSGGALSCESCHGAPFEPRIFEKRWGVKG